jgi:hypothetical protein
MTATAGEWLKRSLSPQTYRRVHSCWWHGHFYLPHLAASVFIRRLPEVQGFPDGDASEPFLHLLRSVNVFAPTEMCRVMTKHGSDKGKGWHNYTTIYSAIFRGLRDQPLRIFELGLGSTSPKFAFSMGPDGRAGASLRGWRELFPHALVFGADIDRDILFEEDRIRTFYCDQLDGAAIDDLWSQPALRGGMDIIIDDGLHTFEGNTSFLDRSLQQLRPGGIYVIEDILDEALNRWRSELETIYPKRFPQHDFALVKLPNATNDYANNLLIVRRSR